MERGGERGRGGPGQSFKGGDLHCILNNPPKGSYHSFTEIWYM